MVSKVVEIKDLKKHYFLRSGCVKALDGISLSVLKGQALAIMGPSGSGKSTLMHILGCLDLPTSGSYLLEGKQIAALDDAALSSLRATSIGFIFQAFNLIAHLTVEENMEIPFFYGGVKKNSFRETIHAALEQVGLFSRRKHRPSQLSGGEMQRVAIARALVTNPKIILADEPTGNLDAKTGQEILALFEKINENGTTLIIVTHDTRVAQICQKTIHLQDGHIVS